MKDKKTIIIVILLCIVFALVGFILGSGKLSHKEEPKPEIVEETNEEVLSKATGEWGMCEGESDCRGAFITKKSDTEFTFSEYIMWSEFGLAGKIETIAKTDTSKYELTVHYEKVETEEYSVEESTEKHTIDTSKLSEEILSIDDKDYQKVTGDRDTFFRSIM
jgi:hypothetical protein